MSGPTERTMLDALYARCAAQGMNPTARRHVLAEQVRYLPGSGHSIADAISIDTWSSGHYALHGYEVKVSRSDFLRELRDPGKHATWARHCERWWIVVPDAQMAREVTDTFGTDHGWGLLVLQGRWLRQIHPARRNTDPAPLPAHALAGLMRATAQTATHHALGTIPRMLLERDTSGAPSLAALRATLRP